MSLSPWLVIARREFLERVRTIWFVIVTLLGPIGLIGIIVVPAWLGATSGATDVRVDVVDRSGRLGEALSQVLTTIGWKVEVRPQNTPNDTEFGRIAEQEIDGFLEVPADVFEDGTVLYSGDNATNQRVVLTLHRLVNTAVQTVRAADEGLPPETMLRILAPVSFDARHTTGSAEAQSGTASFIVGYAVMFILYMAILLYAVNVLRSVVQEKTSRVIEVMASAAKPRSLMFGKIIGVGAVGLFQLSIWAIGAIALLANRETVLGWFGIASGGWALPSLAIADLAVVLGYFLAGYFFYAAIYAAIGAMVNSDQEAQQAQTPVVLLLVIPVVCVQLVANDPRGGIAQVLTLIPFSSPVLMPMRYLLGGATGAEVGLSLAILAASLYVTTAVAARIYRVGILMYGKRPSLRELARWLSYR